MPTPIADYALLTNCRTAALVSRDGSIDWLCLPRFDAPTVFAAILGTEEQGCWTLRPVDPSARSSRRYDRDTFTLITRWETSSGVAEVIDALLVEPDAVDARERVDLVRRVVGLRGQVLFEHVLRLRPDYARALPWVQQVGSESEPAIVGIAGPDAVRIAGCRLEPEDDTHHGRVMVRAGETSDVTLTWFPSYLEAPPLLDVEEALTRTDRWWQDWADRMEVRGRHRALVVRSLLVLRGLTHRETGGIVAAATTSLPEQFGGQRNWDYRYVWLRDAALTIQSLIDHGFVAVERHWRDWLLRAIAGDASQLQIAYGLGGERDLLEREISSLPGYGGAVPVRIGNAAATQYQADVVGEVLVALDAGRRAGVPHADASWPLEVAMLEQLMKEFDRPDHGIWEIRGEPKLFTHSRVMMWAAFDRAIGAVEDYGLEGPVDDWRGIREALREEIDTRGYDAARGHFVQHYGSTEVDASLLLLPRVGFCSPTDPRMIGTVTEIERRLLNGGLVHRYRTESGVDGLKGDEHPFIACSFWLVAQYASSGRVADAVVLMDRVCASANDVGLLSEEYDAVDGLQAGNTPQAFSHLALVDAADALDAALH